MNKLYLWGIIIAALMLLFTYMSVSGSEGGLNGDIVNMLAVGGAVALVIITVFVVIKYVRQMQTDTADGELVDHSWDGIGEYKNSVPMGWAIMFLGTMVWGMWYFTIGYPVNAYSQIGEYNEDTKAHNDKFEAKYADITGERLVDMGESVFLAECKVCHGLQADGIDGSANLNVRLEESVVKHAILNGANNHLLGTEMPMPDRNGLFNANTNEMITDAEIDLVSKYVANGMTGAGADVFQGVCASCHGVDGKGMEYVAPNIAEFTPELVVNVLNHGKKGAIGAMPKFDKLNDKQKEAVGAYITSISTSKETGMNENRGVFVLDGITGMLIATVLLLSILVGLTIWGINVQNTSATNFYDIKDENSIRMIDTESAKNHLVDVEVKDK